MKKGQKYHKRIEREKQIELMEYQDANGIRRKPFRVAFFSAQKILVIKSVLLACLPIFYFIYSPLLFPILLAYGCLYFITKNTENNLNTGLRKDLHVKLPRADAFIAIIVVSVSLGSVLLGTLTTSTRSSMFEGRSKEQITASMKERGMSTSRIDEMMERMEASGAFLTDTEKFVLQVFTLNTGHRVFFQAKNQMAVRSISFSNRRQVMRMRPSGDAGGTTAPADGGNSSFVGGGDRIVVRRRPDMSSIPFSMIINQIVSVINLVALILFILVSIITLVRTKQKKLDKLKRTK